MPRPGPRPYECVRRAWHSDRHQPMRGSIIQQVFRLVNETHSSGTKKNREWQEKLPIVVLKAEEIMYSKANSEAEYMDLETLWGRMNDAIDVIIRKDESNKESGELLQPCIEAALNLGCVPVRASRSQRHSNPRTYLTPTTQELSSIPLRGFDNTATQRCAQLPLCPPGNTFGRSTQMNSQDFDPVTDRHVIQNSLPNAPRGFPFRFDNHPRVNQSMAMEPNAPLKLGLVYPLYYGTHYQSEETVPGFHTSQHENIDTIFVGTPVGTTMVEPAKKGVMQLHNLFTSDSTGCTLNRLNRVDIKHTYEKTPEIMCDLSLQLGLSPKVKISEQETINCGGKFHDLSPQKGKEICLFPRTTGFDTFSSSSSKWSSEDIIGPNMHTTLRKRKIPLSENMDQFTCRTKWPGL